DPSLPANGVTILTNADVPEHPVLDVLRAVPDAAGGVYVLISCCNPFLPHTRCYEAAEFRLLHSTASGTTASGWPALGVVINARQAYGPSDYIDIVPDGGGGVIAVWLDGSFPIGGAPPVLAQRFAPDGSAVWPGGAAGLVVLAPHLQRGPLRAAPG